MTAEQFLSLAEALRSYARHSERDLNAANLFVHSVLMRAVRSNGFDPTRITPLDLVREQQRRDAA